MAKEQIEKAAAEYRNDLLCDAALEVNFEEDNYDAGVRDCIVKEIPKAFAKGAEWRINSVWHNAKTTPKENSKIVLIDKYGDLYNISYSSDKYGDMFGKGWESCVREYEIDKWAYLKDLTPDRKEGEKCTKLR